MLFLINKTQFDALNFIKMFGGKGEKRVLLIGDGAYYANRLMVSKFRDQGVSEIYVAEDALVERDVKMSPDSTKVDYDRIVSLIFEEEENVISI